MGDLVGNYRITGKLGEGGMGTVYVAEHAMLGRRAAIKVLRAELCHRGDLVTRFFNEARAATAVKHPGIVEIYDFGHAPDGSAFIVMEFLDGESLSARLRRVGVLPERRAAAICRQVGHALAAAHAKGIVHRDLKPDNIFIVPDPDIADGERTKVLDFGIAKLIGGDTSGAGQTKTGMVLGTPTYMSPEQCKGTERVDHRTDIYALGCILFEMVCGRPPFPGDGVGELMVAHMLGEVPKPSSIQPVSPPIEQVILRALAKDPNERFVSVSEMTAALQLDSATGELPRASAMHPTIIAPESRKQTTLTAAAGAAIVAQPPRSRRTVAIAGALGVVIAGGVAAYALMAASGVAEPAAPAPTVAAMPVTPPKAAVTPPPAPSHVEPPPPAMTPSKAQITLHVESKPPGAEVYLVPQGVRLGVTPLDHVMDPVAGELVLIVKKPGYTQAQVALAADHDGTTTVTLEKPRVTSKPHETPRTSTAPGSLDPFERMGAKP